jgi:hypothetical protein
VDRLIVADRFGDFPKIEAFAADAAGNAIAKNRTL